MHQLWQQRPKFTAPVFIFSLGQLRQVGQSLPDGRIEFTFKQWQKRVPHTVACMAGVEIGSVLPPWLSQRFEVGLNFNATGGQQRPNQVLRLLGRSNTGQAASAGSTKDSHEHGFS